MAHINVEDKLYHELMRLAGEQGQDIDSLLHRLLDDLESGSDDFSTGFARLLSHDLRTPLATIMTSSDLLKHYHDRLNEERMQEHLDTIQSHVQILDGQLDNLTILYRIRNHGLAFNPQHHDLDELCNAVLQRIGSYLHAPNEMLYDSPVEPVQALYDTGLMRVALANILTNAIKFSPENSAIELALAPRPGGAVLEVRDSGIGIPAEDLPQVRGLFFRGSNVGSLRGEGLGLAVAEQIVELHRGTLSIDSQVGEGTQVSIALPREG